MVRQPRRRPHRCRVGDLEQRPARIASLTTDPKIYANLTRQHDDRVRRRWLITCGVVLAAVVVW
jgi:hypothetical protein